MSCHPQHGYRSYAGRSTPCIAVWASPAAGDASERDSRCGLRQLKRRVEKRTPGGWPMLAHPAGLGRKHRVSTCASNAARTIPRTRCINFAGTPRAGHLILPVPPRQQNLLRPLLRERGDGGVLQVSPNPLPPEVHQCRHIRQLLLDLRHGFRPLRQLRGAG